MGGKVLVLDILGELFLVVLCKVWVLCILFWFLGGYLVVAHCYGGLQFLVVVYFGVALSFGFVSKFGFGFHVLVGCKVWVFYVGGIVLGLFLQLVGVGFF